jgi:hypothetical protein
MFVWSFRFALVDERSAARFVAGQDVAALAMHGDRYGLHASADPAIKGWNHHVDITQKAFERARRRAMLGQLDRGIPPVAHQVGCTVKRYRFAFRFGTRTTPL